MNRSISPPLIPRQSQQFKTRTSLPAKSGTLRIFAWNVNGLASFVAPDLQGRPGMDQHSIRSFFKTDPRTVETSGKRKREGEENEHGSTEGDGAWQVGRADGKPSLRGALRRLGWPHILCLQEIKIKRGDERTMDAVRAAVNDASTDGGPAYDVHFNLAQDPHNAKGFGGKIYGVATVVQRVFARAYIETIRDVAWDKEGRVQIIETRDSANAVKFAIINIYAVNGTSNPHRSPERSVIGTRHDRKLAVHFELLREARRLEAGGFAVVVAGDVNVARDARDGYPCLRTWPRQHVVNREDFNEKFFSGNSGGATARGGEEDVDGPLVGFNGIDTFRSVHGDARRYSYYPRGRDWGSSCDRVDLIIASRVLDRLLVDAGICDNPRDRGPSDHCPIWAEFGYRLE
ncbi:DNase I-like protein [Xylaria cf. heliscus]|nr:DNase I-like protein [Xylaria cf. heliscus]